MSADADDDPVEEAARVIARACGDMDGRGVPIRVAPERARRAARELLIELAQHGIGSDTAKPIH